MKTHYTWFIFLFLLNFSATSFAKLADEDQKVNDAKRFVSAVNGYRESTATLADIKEAVAILKRDGTQGLPDPNSIDDQMAKKIQVGQNWFYINGRRVVFTSDAPGTSLPPPKGPTQSNSADGVAR